MNRVVVYKNLTRGCWSIAEVKGQRGRGQVIGYAASLVLTDCVMVTSAARQAAIKAAMDSKGEKKREVHAWVIGTLVPNLTVAAKPAGAKRLAYSPYRGPDFTVDGQAVTSAPTVVFAADGEAYV